MKPRDSIKTAIDLVENESCIVFHACEADKFRRDKQKFDHRFLLFTNISVLFFKIGSKPKQLFCEYWSNLVGIKGLISRDPVITLFFKQDIYKFKIDDPQEIKTVRLKLGDLFQRIFTTEEQEMLKLYKSDLYQISCHSTQNSFGQYSRFISYIKSNKIEIEKDTEKRFFKYLVYHQKDISMPKKIKSNEFESFMYGIDALTFIESISFKEMNNIDIFYQLLSFYTTLFDDPSIFFANRKENDQNTYSFQFRFRDNIRHIKFNKIKTMNNFDEFFFNLTNGQIEHNLNGLSFENMKLIEKNFYSIDKLCRSLKSRQKSNSSSGMRSLSFNSSLSEEQYNYFLSSFLNNDTTKHLYMLSLNNTYNLSMPLLLDKIRNIYSLSLADCNINIMTTLQCIGRARMENLRMLNLSGNFCSKNAPPDFNAEKNKKEKKKKKDMSYDAEKYNPNDDVEFDDDDFVFPPSLNVLYVRDVKWGLRFRSLIAFLKAASSFRPKTTNNNTTFRLSIRGIKGGRFNNNNNDNQFNSSLNYFNDFNSYLAGLFTDIKKSFITHLDWAGNPVSSEFIEFLRKSKKLIELDVSYCFSSELEDDDRNSTRSDNKNSPSNSLLRHFSDYLVKDAKNLESLIICGRTKTSNDDDGKKKDSNSGDNGFLSQNLRGHSIFPLFQAIKETKNPLSYVNISGQKLENPYGLNFFSEAIGSNPNIEKVSFKNTGFESKEQFNYFVSKVKRSRPIFVEWPGNEMKNIADSNISHFKNLLIRLSKLNFYYEDKSRKNSIVQEKPSKTDKKNRKSRAKEEYSEDYSDDGNDIKFDKLLFGKNLMARKIEAFQFDTDREFPSYFSKEVEELIAPSQNNNNNNDSDEEDSNKKKKNKKKQKKNDSENNSDSDSEEDEIKAKSVIKKKASKKVIKKVSESESNNESDDDDDDDDEDEIDLKNKKKLLLNKSKKKRNISDDDDDEDDEDEDNDDKNLKKMKKKNKNKPINRGVSISSDYEDNDDNENDDDESDDDKEKWKFPNGISPKNDKKSIKEIKEKFSMENLMTNLVNLSD